MYIQRTDWTNKVGKTYQSIWLGESYQEDGKVKTQNIANLKNWSSEEVEALESVLKKRKKTGKKKREESSLENLMVKIKDVVVEQGLSIGAVYAVAQIAKRLGIEKVLGKTQEGKLALWQVIARVLEQGSRLSAVRMAQLHCVVEVLDFKKGFTENDLYKNLSWIAEKQDKFEKKLFDERYPQGKKPVLFLYDVTSSYLEGTQNEFARYGYNRDKKQGKKQIVIGFLSDENGKGISVEVFEGNTSDPKTVLDQIHKIAQRFGCEQVTFVGDRGMLKSQNPEDLKAQEFSYITGITKPQIQKLINDGKLQLGLFDTQLKEEVADGVRYIYRMNPVRAQEIAKTRKEKVQKTELWIERLNTYLTEHSRAKVETAVRNMEKMLEKYGLLSWLKPANQGRILKLMRDEEAYQKVRELDGCYVLKTNVPEKTADKEIIHSRYKSLSQVERAFRNGKSELDLRPIFVRTKESTRGHVFVIMLAYRIWQELEAGWKELNLTVKEGLEHLKSLGTVNIKLPGGKELLRITQPNEICSELLEALQIKLPDTLEKNQSIVHTYKELSRKI